MSVWLSVMQICRQTVNRIKVQHMFFFFFFQSVELDLKNDCKPLMERINVFKAAFSENEDDERYGGIVSAD